MIGLLIYAIFAAPVCLFIGWLCSLFCAAVFGYVQPAWVFAIGWFLLTNILRMVRGK